MEPILFGGVNCLLQAGMNTRPLWLSICLALTYIRAREANMNGANRGQGHDRMLLFLQLNSTSHFLIELLYNMSKLV